MQQSQPITNTIIKSVSLIITALIISVAAIFCTLQFNQTQLKIAEEQKDSRIEQSKNIKQGLDKIGNGICKTSTKATSFCL